MIISQENRVLYSQYNVTSTDYVYTDAGASGAEDGWVGSKYDEIFMQISCATLTATTLYYRVEGRFDKLSRPALVVEASVNSAHSIDELVTISGKVKELRVGTKVNAVASPLIAKNYLYCGLVLSEER